MPSCASGTLLPSDIVSPARLNVRYVKPSGSAIRLTPSRRSAVGTSGPYPPNPLAALMRPWRPMKFNPCIAGIAATDPAAVTALRRNVRRARPFFTCVIDSSVLRRSRARIRAWRQSVGSIRSGHDWRVTLGENCRDSDATNR
jgi:hypothetical protein